MGRVYIQTGDRPPPSATDRDRIKRAARLCERRESRVWAEFISRTATAGKLEIPDVDANGDYLQEYIHPHLYPQDAMRLSW